MAKFLMLPVILSTLLIACGGGGSEQVTPVTPPVVTPEPLPIVTMMATPDSCIIPVNKGSCSVSVTYSTVNSSNVSLFSEQGAVLSTNLNDTIPVAVINGNNVFTLNTKGNSGSVVTSLTVKGSCEVPSILDTVTSVCIIPPNICDEGKTWNTALKSCIAKAETKVEIAKQLPLGCSTWKDACWSLSIKNDTVKFITSSLVLEGNKQNIMFAYFRNTTNLFGVDGMWNVLPFYIDTGSPFGQDISGGIAEEIDWVYGNSLGAIAHVKSTNTCIQFALDSTLKTFVHSPVSCPNGTTTQVVEPITPTPPVTSEPITTCLLPLIPDGNGNCVLPLPVPITIPAPEPVPVCVSPTIPDGIGHCILPLPISGK
ncbi:MAG: hypothetical protein KBC41_03430 [Candidatus Pacebacteria bacterium]|nr:hypothetical protein [Candidatus Paceibacterota bacterium]